MQFNFADITNPESVFEDAKLLDYDVLYYRTSIGSIWAQALEKYLAKHRKRAINLDILTHPYRYYKTYQAYVAGKSGVKTPKTILDTTGSYEKISKSLGGTFVVKADISAQGRDVHLVHSEEEFLPYAENQSEKEYFYQEYIPHDFDCRVHMIEGKPVASYRRVPVDGDFRTNVSRGAQMEPVDESMQKDLYPLAEKITQSMELNICAVDFIVRNTDGEYFFTEVNLNPGWELSDQDATGVHMSALVIDYFEKITGSGL